MKPTIVAIEKKMVVGLGSKFISILNSKESNGPRIIPPLWQAFNRRETEIQHRISGASIGYCEPLPLQSAGSPGECFYLACVEVSDFGKLPSGMETREIPAGRYAVFTHKGKLNNLPETYREIYAGWLPGSGEKRTASAEFELYDQRFKDGSDDSEFDIYIPLQGR